MWQIEYIVWKVIKKKINRDERLTKIKKMRRPVKKKTTNADKQSDRKRESY